MRQKLADEIEQLSHELNVVIPQAIAQAVELGDLRENSEYKAALERQQFVQARLGQLHTRISQLSQLAHHETPTDRVGLGSTVTVVDLKTKEKALNMVVAEMMDIDEGHIPGLPARAGAGQAGGRRDRTPAAARHALLRVLSHPMAGALRPGGVPKSSSCWWAIGC
jgi:transcription elongation factor GreA